MKLHLLQDRCFFVFVFLVLGGSASNGRPRNQVYSMINSGNEWKEISPMIQAHSCPGVVDEKIFFVLGGKGNVWEFLDTIKVYDLKTEKWKMMKKKMPTKRWELQ